MLSNKEKKAIEILKEFLEKLEEFDFDCQECGFNQQDEGKALKIMFNLIEKQSREIEELKNKSDENLAYYDQIYQNGIYTGQKAVEDKIKAKIEPKLKELDTQINEEWKKYGNSKELQDMEDMYNFLQSLLEKE